MPAPAQPVRLGLRENLTQFSLLVLVNAFVGAMVGLERTIYDFAHRRPWTYGLLCVLIAAAVGWSASRIFRRT